MNSENGNIVVNFRLVSLCNAFSNPYNVPAFLFLELDVSVKHSEMELLLKRERVHLNLERKTTASVRYIMPLFPILIRKKIIIIIVLSGRVEKDGIPGPISLNSFR